MKALACAALLACAASARAASAPAPAADDAAAYARERRKAFAVFEKDGPAALPLFEALKARRPDDAQVLTALAGCLIQRALTLDDAAAAAARLRAKELLLRSAALGDKSVYAQNLLQAASGLAADGRVTYSKNPAVDAAMREAEAAFGRRDSTAALRGYARALALDPKNYAAALFSGDVYFQEKDYANAGRWYERAQKIDPDRETAYRYQSDMLEQAGDLAGARAKAIDAVVAEPYNAMARRALRAWAETAGVSVYRTRLSPPADVAVGDDGKYRVPTDADRPTDVSAAWQAYSLTQVKWRGGEFARRFPGEKKYRRTLAERAEALKAAAAVWRELNAGKTPAAADADLDLLGKLADAGFVESYVLLDAPDDGVAPDYAAYRAGARDKLARYLGEFDVPPAPAR